MLIKYTCEMSSQNWFSLRRISNYNNQLKRKNKGIFNNNFEILIDTFSINSNLFIQNICYLEKEIAE